MHDERVEIILNKMFEGEKSLRQIARETNIPFSSVRKIVKKLEKRGIIRREHDRYVSIHYITKMSIISELKEFDEIIARELEPLLTFCVMKKFQSAVELLKTSIREYIINSQRIPKILRILTMRAIESIFSESPLYSLLIVLLAYFTQRTYQLIVESIKLTSHIDSITKERIINKLAGEVELIQLFNECGDEIDNLAIFSVEKLAPLLLPRLSEEQSIIFKHISTAFYHIHPIGQNLLKFGPRSLSEKEIEAIKRALNI